MSAARRTEDERTFAYEVPPALDGARLDAALCALDPTLSRRRVWALVDDGLVRVDGRRTKKGARVATGQRITSTATPSARDFDAAPDADAALTVVYEDDACVVIDKPAGQPSHPLAADERGAAANALVARYPSMRGVGYRRREPGLVHRLDTGTSGLLIAAKSSGAFEALRDTLRAEQIDKRYQALCVGSPAPGAIDLPIRQRRAGRVEASPRGNQPARTEVLRVAPFRLAGGAQVAQVEVRARHARRHQVRAHLAAIGHPLLGDARYGGPAVEGLARHALHASRLIFRSPAGASVDVVAPLPLDLARLLGA